MDDHRIFEDFIVEKFRRHQDAAVGCYSYHARRCVATYLILLLHQQEEFNFYDALSAGVDWVRVVAVHLSANPSEQPHNVEDADTTKLIVRFVMEELDDAVQEHIRQWNEHWVGPSD